MTEKHQNTQSKWWEIFGLRKFFFPNEREDSGIVGVVINDFQQLYTSEKKVDVSRMINSKVTTR